MEAPPVASGLFKCKPDPPLLKTLGLLLLVVAMGPSLQRVLTATYTVLPLLPRPELFSDEPFADVASLRFY